MNSINTNEHGGWHVESLQYWKAVHLYSLNVYDINSLQTFAYFRKS